MTALFVSPDTAIADIRKVRLLSMDMLCISIESGVPGGGTTVCLPGRRAAFLQKLRSRAAVGLRLGRRGDKIIRNSRPVCFHSSRLNPAV